MQNALIGDSFMNDSSMSERENMEINIYQDMNHLCHTAILHPVHVQDFKYDIF